MYNNPSVFLKMLVAAVFFLLIYGLIIGYYTFQWGKTQSWPATTAIPPLTVIVAARNESRHLPQLLRSLQAQDYPADSWQVIIIDDHSEDQTDGVVSSFGDPRIQIVSLPDGKSGKKAAITWAVGLARTELLLITDADCVLPSTWMRTMTAGFTEGVKMVAGPVSNLPAPGFLWAFQTLDFLVLQGITGATAASGTPVMCNGANLAYTRSAFLDLCGFQGIDHLASGDDMLLMQKLDKLYRGSVKYCRSDDAIVETQPPLNWVDFLQQRKRWASKSSAYSDPWLKTLLSFIFLFNVFFLVVAVYGFIKPVCFLYLPALLLAKTLIEWPFVSAVARFFGQASLMKFFPVSQPLHILYTVVVGIWSQFGKYSWKGRRVG